MEGHFNYLALGDSYTIGEGVDPQDRWPVKLSEFITTYGLKVHTTKIIAKTGWTTAELIKGIFEDEINNRFDLVSLLIGVNNQYRGLDKEDFRIEFNELLDIGIGFAGGINTRMFVVSIPDWGVNPFARDKDRSSITREVDAFNRVAREESQKKGVLYIDITSISRLAANDSLYTANDGLHPSARMYAMWVDKISVQVLRLLP